ncbi:signal protein [Undibacterium arcticum]|uniref:Signal protein n=2 Tax=Undibacterium arcticum TaxID=1762892 RepID=A0ABV7EZF5_9BURK
MKLFLRSLALSAGFLLSAHGFAQTYTATPPTKPAASVPAPAATTGAMTAKPAAPATTDAMTAPAKKATNSTSKMPATAASGGGDGKVWVNTASKTYHCPGTKYYGKTKAGEYMTEADAKAKGNHPDHKKVCS